MTDSDIALVTGANRGIGHEIARQLAQRGMTVYAAARDDAKATAAADGLAGAGDVRALALDVADDASVGTAAARLEAEQPRLDVLVNNAAINLDLDEDGPRPLEATTAEGVRRTFAVNVAGLVAVTQAVLPLLRNGRGARIVNLTTELASLAFMSDPTHRAATRILPAYSASKAAVNALTLLYANVLRADGILVNAASPGLVATDMNYHQGPLSVEEGAQVPVRLATLAGDGPTGGFFGHDGPLPW